MDGLTSIAGIAFSPVGEHVYVSSGWGGNAVSWYDRNASSGALTWRGVLKDGQGGVDGLYSAGKLVVSPEGTHVYVTAYDDDAVSCYQRNPVSGALTWLAVAKDGVGGVERRLVLGGVADEALGLREGDVRGRHAVALIVGDDLDAAVLVDADARVGGAQVNADDVTDLFFLLLVGRREGEAEGEVQHAEHVIKGRGRAL